MRTKIIASALLCLLAGCATTEAGREAGPEAAASTVAPKAQVTELFSKDLTDIPGNKEGQMIVVEYPPGSSDAAHRHNAHAFVYVLEGSIVMQLKGQKQVTLKAGETFYEGPDDIHVIGRNASETERARFVVVLLKQKGAPVVLPLE